MLSIEVVDVRVDEEGYVDREHSIGRHKLKH
jgi:hypothetical protein